MESDSSWCSVLTRTGYGNARVRIGVAKNGGGKERTARVTVSANGIARTVCIRQLGRQQKNKKSGIAKYLAVAAACVLAVEVQMWRGRRLPDEPATQVDTQQPASTPTAPVTVSFSDK